MPFWEIAAFFWLLAYSVIYSLKFQRLHRSLTEWTNLGSPTPWFPFSSSFLVWDYHVESLILLICKFFILLYAKWNIYVQNFHMCHSFIVFISPIKVQAVWSLWHIRLSSDSHWCWLASLSLVTLWVVIQHLLCISIFQVTVQYIYYLPR